MNFLFLSAAFIAVAAAQYAPPASDPVYEPEPPQYQPPQSGYPAPKPYPGHYDDYNKGGFRKLRNLNINSVHDARKRYFTHRNENYVAISCPRNSASGKYVWILADSRDTIPSSFGIPDTVALAGGVNVEFVAKLGRHGKWEGRDFFHDEKQRFRRVGCYFGTTDSGLV